MFYTVSIFYTTIGGAEFAASDPICIIGGWITNIGLIGTGYTTCSPTVTYLTEVGSTRTTSFLTYRLPDDAVLTTTFTTNVP